jgi:hypothetical protein
VYFILLNVVVFKEVIDMIENVSSVRSIHIFMAFVLFGIAYFLLNSFTDFAGKATDFQLFVLAGVAGACLIVVRKVFP